MDQVFEGSPRAEIRLESGRWSGTVAPIGPRGCNGR